MYGTEIYSRKNINPMTNNLRPINRSIVVLSLQVIILLLTTDTIYGFINYFFLKVHFLRLTLPFDLHHYSIQILYLSHILKSFFQIFVLMQLIFKWKSQSYYIINEHLVKKEGLMTITEKNYDLKNIRSVTIQQSVLGKIFRFGNIVLEISALGGYKEILTIPFVSNPQIYESLLLHS